MDNQDARTIWTEAARRRFRTGSWPQTFACAAVLAFVVVASGCRTSRGGAATGATAVPAKGHAGPGGPRFQDAERFECCEVAFSVLVVRCLSNR